METQRNIFLVGLMGVGKTTIGRQLAAALKMDFHDSDHEIEHRTGANIPLIFDLEGEDGFRKREASVIDELTQQPGIVLATGGGAILSETNRKHLKTRGRVIYLYSDIDHLFQRTRRDRNRPLLQTEDPRAKLEELMTVRDPLYREVADMIVDTGHCGVRKSVQTILANIENKPD